ncbi:MAG TPA: aspartate 1-decarboxylase [Sedimentisphaerales bacterium]|nr:aspartate 1-decarboxylase [Sedimentisphaerales bacterium]
MLVKLLKSKLHRATVTDAIPDYPGSIRIDSELTEAVGILPYESVLIADLDNGCRLETYVVPDDPGSGKIVILGAAARLVKPGHKVIILSFGLFTEREAETFKPKIAVLDENNRITKTSQLNTNDYTLYPIPL